MRIDLHVHSAVSDGTDTPSELVSAAKQAGLDAVGLCDHDTMAGLSEAEAAGKEIGVRVFRGMEMSTEYQGHEVHLLCYGTRSADERLQAELEKLHDARVNRLAKMLERLKALGYQITEADVQQVAVDTKNVGRPHVADALVKLGYFDNRTEVFAQLLDHSGKAYVPRYKTPLLEAISMIRANGGATVWAHPLGRGGARWITEEILGLMAESGLDGIEVWHQDHDSAQREWLAELAARLKLIPTGGSDYHGTGKINHPLGANLTPQQSWDSINARVSERGGVSEG